MEQDNNLVILFTNKEITKLFKSFLEIIEDLHLDNNLLIKRLSEQYGEEYINQINYFTKEKHEHLRKRILDAGNETNRNLINFLEFYDFYMNKEKLEKALNNRKTVKRFTTSSPVIVEYIKE